MTKRAAKADKKLRVKTMTFERALAALRSGKATMARRIEWHPESKIVRVGTDIFVMNRTFFGPAPKKWEPFTYDFLAKDWVLLG